VASVRLDQIVRRFSKGMPVGDISFTVPDGQFWVLVGPSGCGKSTILRMIAGLDTPTSGDLYINDQCVNTVPARQRDVAMVFQNYALYPHMRVADNLAFGLKMRGADPATIQSRIQAVAQILDIAHLLERYPRQLSGGQQQRVALGRAIARAPQVFLLDEPLSNLDAQLRDSTRTELKQLHQRVGITTLYVTHDQTEAMTLADQIVVLHQGQIQQIGSPQDIYLRPANRQVATFLGNPPMNVLPAIYTGEGYVIGDFTVPCRAEFRPDRPPGPVDLGIRPEHIRVTTSNGDLRVEVKVVEPIGQASLLRVQLLGSDPGNQLGMTLQVPLELCARGADRLHLMLNFEQVLLFDPTTGERLHPPLAERQI
jgi:multiple sugar transport system ATP-binding protein